jgi:hypothetical protein
MRTIQAVKVVVAVSAPVMIALLVMFSGSQPVRADDANEEALVTRGFQIAPVPLNLYGRNRALVGLGSYIVNAVSDCNSCHNSGQTLDGMFLAGRNPYRLIPGSLFSQPKKIDPSTYFGGGQPFGTVDFKDPSPDNPVIVSRNLTPDKTGRAEGHTLADFMKILRTGVDMDNVHPKLPAGFDGKLLQVMPWPTFQNMTDHYIEAIYEFLSAIPCLEGGPGEPAHRCR